MRAEPGRAWHEFPQSVCPLPRPIALSTAASAGLGLPTRRAQPGPPRTSEHAQCAASRARWIFRSWFSTGPGGGGAAGGARGLSLDQRIQERRKSGSWLGHVRVCGGVGKGTGKALVGRWRPSSLGSGVCAYGGSSARSCGRGRHLGPERALVLLTPVIKSPWIPLPDPQRGASRGRRPKGHLHAGAASGASSPTCGAALFLNHSPQNITQPSLADSSRTTSRRTKKTRIVCLQHCLEEGSGELSRLKPSMG